MTRTRYAILHHVEIPQPHFDLMLETAPGSLLATWRSNVWPIEASVRVQRLCDHRRAFLDFEGELSGRRGSVTRVAGGMCRVEVVAESVWRVELLSGSSPLVLELRPTDADQWEARPI